MCRCSFRPGLTARIAAAEVKPQIPNPKHQGSVNIQAPNIYDATAWNLKFGASLEFGVLGLEFPWGLGFGIWDL